MLGFGSLSMLDMKPSDVLTDGLMRQQTATWAYKIAEFLVILSFQ
jgi:hypothetical protein